MVPNLLIPCIPKMFKFVRAPLASTCNDFFWRIICNRTIRLFLFMCFIVKKINLWELWKKKNCVKQIIFKEEIIRTHFPSGQCFWYLTMSIKKTVSTLQIWIILIYQNKKIIPNIAGGPSVYTESIIQISRSCFEKKLFTHWKTSFTNGSI